MSPGKGASAGRRNLLPRLSLRTWLLGSHILVLLLPLLALLATGALAMDLRRQTRADLEHQADVLTVFLADAIAQTGDEPLSDLLARIDPLLVAVTQRTLASVRVVDHSGRVVASSQLGAREAEDLSGDEVVQRALAGGTGIATRRREAARERQPLSSPSRRARVRLFVAKPILVVDAAGNAEVVGAVLLSRTPREELQALYHMAPRLVWGQLIALVLTVALAVFAGRLGTRSLESLATAARRITHGSGGEDTKLMRSAGSHVDEVHALALATTAMAELLQSRVAYINEFAGNVAHEFRTPIATLRGTAELLRDDEQMDPAQRRRFLDNALDELERLERLVGGLLTLARAEQPHAGGVVDLAELLSELPRRWPELIVDASGEGHENPDSAGEIEGSPAQLAAVLDNLIENAYTHGGSEVEVHVRGLSRPDLHAGFEVVDDGPGISAANLSHVFDRFFTTNRDQGGTGLGLALVQRIVDTHGGHVEVESQPGRTVFRVWFPA